VQSVYVFGPLRIEGLTDKFKNVRPCVPAAHVQTQSAKKITVEGVPARGVYCQNAVCSKLKHALSLRRQCLSEGGFAARVEFGPSKSWRGPEAPSLGCSKGIRCSAPRLFESGCPAGRVNQNPPPKMSRIYREDRSMEVLVQK
jgi:hypothetical protein